MQAQLLATPLHKEVFDEFISKQKAEVFDGDINNLQNAVSSVQLETWYNLWYQLQIEPPARQTCFIVTLNEPVIHELARAVGRPMLGKARGRILELATGERQQEQDVPRLDFLPQFGIESPESKNDLGDYEKPLLLQPSPDIRCLRRFAA